MVVRCNKQKVYEKNYNNVVGASESSLRTVTAHDDTNSIYVAPNGDDSTGDGTSSAPFLTLEHALNNMGSMNILTIIRNGYVGDMVFAPPVTPLPDDLVLQVEAEEIASIQVSDELKVSNIDDALINNEWMNSLQYRNGLWVALCVYESDDDASGFRIYYSTDGINWSDTGAGSYFRNLAASPDGDVWVVMKDTGTTSGSHQIYTSTDGITWALSSAPEDTYNSIAVSNDIIIVTITLSTSNLYSQDGGSTWDTVDIGYDLRLPCYSSYYDRFYYGGSAGNLYSNDGLNWLEYDTPATFPNRLSETEGGYLVGMGGDGFVYSSDGINFYLGNTPESTVIEYWYGIACSGNLFIAVSYVGNAADGRMVVSTDGISWKTLESSKRYNTIASNREGMFIAGVAYPSTLTNLHQLVESNGFSIKSDNCEINGFDIFGTSVTFALLYGHGSSSLTLKWCTIQSCANGMKNFAQANIQNTLFLSLDGYAIDGVDNPIITDCLFHSIEGTAVNHSGDELNINHCTFYDCGTGIKINDEISTITAFKNLVLAACGTLIEAVHSVSLDYSIADNQRGLVNCTLGTGCIVGVKPLFHDADNQDFKLWHKEEGFAYDSAGAFAASDGEDCGCYRVSFSVSSLEWHQYNLPPQSIEVLRSKTPVKAENNYTYSGAFKRFVLDFLWELAIEALESTKTNLLFQMNHIISDDNPLQVFPVGRDVWSTSEGSGELVIIHNYDSLPTNRPIAQLIMGDTDMQIFKQYYQEDIQDTPVGSFIVVQNVTGMGSYPNIPFKIINWDGMNELTLECIMNIELSSDNDGFYAFNVVKTAFVAPATFLGVNDNGYLVFDCTLIQSFEYNQWKGFWFHTAYDTDLGSGRQYFRVVKNSSNYLYCDNPLDNPLPAQDTHVISIDMLMMKAQPDTIESEPTEPVTHGKFGNDWYSTLVTREEHDGVGLTGFLHGNETGQKLVLIESEDFDGDGL